MGDWRGRIRFLDLSEIRIYILYFLLCFNEVIGNKYMDSLYWDCFYCNVGFLKIYRYFFIIIF